MKRPALKHGDVYPAHVLRDEYGMNAANRPVITVNVSEVPESLRDLIPLVERWAIPCDVTRGDYFAHQPQEDIASFWYAVLPRVDAIHEWLNSLQSPPTASMHFIYFLKAHDEAWQPTEDEKRELERRRAQSEHDLALKDAVKRGVQAFNEHNYPAVVEILELFEKDLGPVAMGKLSYARKKVMG